MEDALKLLCKSKILFRNKVFKNGCMRHSQITFDVYKQVQRRGIDDQEMQHGPGRSHSCPQVLSPIDGPKKL